MHLIQFIQIILVLSHGAPLSAFSVSLHNSKRMTSSVQKRNEYSVSCKTNPFDKRHNKLNCQSIPEGIIKPDAGDEEGTGEEEEDTGMQDEDNYMGGGNQYDDYMDGLTDEGMIEAMRLERIVANDRWQSCMIRDKQGGEWTGSYEMFTPVAGVNGFKLQKADSGTIRSSVTAGVFNLEGVPISFSEAYVSTPPFTGSDKSTTAHSLLLSQTRKDYKASDFRPSEGNQIVANVYTLSKIIGGELVTVDSIPVGEEGATYMIPESYVAEIAIREEMIRTRVRFAYSNKLTAAMGEAEKEAGKYDVFLEGLTIIRECLTESSPSEIKPLFDETLGSGIYDPQVSGEPYVQINLPGKLSLLFPRGIRGALNKAGHALTMEWEGKAMRYQVDRRFNELTNGVVRSLELTEVRAADAAEYPPGFAIKPDYMTSS